MPWETILGTFVGTLCGAIITWLVSRHYYKKAGDELIKESEKLKLTSDLIIYKLQYPDATTEIMRNQKGEVTGLAVSMSAKL
jgi:hypothetical protein